MPELTAAEAAKLREATEELEQFKALLANWPGNVEFDETERAEFLDFFNQMKHFFSNNTLS
jgi:hypothetical protein